MTLARFSRSASAWRAIARCIVSGSSTSLTSTVAHLHAPWLGLLVDDLLEPFVDAFALGQQFVKLGLAQHAPQRRLGDQRGRPDVVGDADDGPPGIDDPEVGYGVDFDRDVVAGDDLLRRGRPS